MKLQEVRQQLRQGLVIPACPLPLDQRREWSPRHQTALTRYYAAAGAGGLAVGVHSTQFAIRDPGIDLYRPVLELVSQELDRLQTNPAETHRPIVKVAGVCGGTNQAIAEAATAIELGYHAGLLSMTAFNQANEREILTHCQTIAERIPLFGFYLQPAVGGRVFSYRFWRQFCEIPQLVAIKVAPFNRYQTLDVMRAVQDAGRADVALYTGNDDHIIGDLLTPFAFDSRSAKAPTGPTDEVSGESANESANELAGNELASNELAGNESASNELASNELASAVSARYFEGGLLGQWGVWTRRAVEWFEQIQQERQAGSIDRKWLQRNVALTDANAAIFDAANQFAGCIPGILEVLRRQGLVPTAHCLDPQEQLSPGQAEELDRVQAAYPELNDDEFVREHLDEWLK